MLAIIEPSRSDDLLAAPALLLDFLIFGVVGRGVVLCGVVLEALLVACVATVEIPFFEIESTSTGGGGGTSIGKSGGGSGGFISYGGKGGGAIISGVGCGSSGQVISISFTLGSRGGATAAIVESWIETSSDFVSTTLGFSGTSAVVIVTVDAEDWLAEDFLFSSLWCFDDDDDLLDDLLEWDRWTLPLLLLFDLCLSFLRWLLDEDDVRFSDLLELRLRLLLLCDLWINFRISILASSSFSFSLGVVVSSMVVASPGVSNNSFLSFSFFGLPSCVRFTGVYGFFSMWCSALNGCGKIVCFSL